MLSMVTAEGVARAASVMLSGLQGRTCNMGIEGCIAHATHLHTIAGSIGQRLEPATSVVLLVTGQGIAHQANKKEPTWWRKRKTGQGLPENSLATAWARCHTQDSAYTCMVANETFKEFDQVGPAQVTIIGGDNRIRCTTVGNLRIATENGSVELQDVRIVPGFGVTY